VRVKVPLLGGGFGAKVIYQARGAGGVARVAGAAARQAGADHWTSSSRSSPSIRPRSASRAAVTKTGKLTARPCEVYWNRRRLCGYRAAGDTEIWLHGRPGLTDIGQRQIDSYELYTNRPPAGALRGFAFRSWSGPMRAILT